MAATEPIRNKKYISKIAGYYLKRGNIRNYSLIIMGVHTALRISDLLRLTWNDVYDFEAQRFYSHIRLVEQKTGKRKSIALNKEVIRALCLLADVTSKQKEGLFLFANNRKKHAAISRIQAYRIIRKAAEALGLPYRISCHSLRKTFGYHAWKKGVSPVVIMDIYNHTSFDVTRRYLGVCQDDRDKVYMDMTFA